MVMEEEGGVGRAGGKRDGTRKKTKMMRKTRKRKVREVEEDEEVEKADEKGRKIKDVKTGDEKTRRKRTGGK